MDKLLAYSVATLVLLGTLYLGGCFPPTEREAAIAAQTATDMRLPVSLNEVMVAMVNNAADPIWLAAWRHPEDNDTWRALERNAYQLEIAGSLLAVPGTGPLDDAWTSDPKWGFFCEQLKEAGRNARIAIANRDLEAIKLAGDDLVEICEGCHIAFKPAEPTAGKFGELSPTEADFEED